MSLRAAGALVAATLAVVFPSAASAASTTFVPSADSYVSSGAPNTNYGSRNRLWVQTGPPIKRAYLKFDVSLPTGSTVTGATLRLYVGTSSTPTGYLAYGVADTSWGEGTITYANAPGFGAELGSSGGWASGHFYTSVSLSSGYIHAGVNSVGVGTPSTTPSGFAFWSRETGNPPDLVVAYTTSPDTTPPSVPTGLTATPGNGQVSLSWNASTDPDDAVAGYNIYRNGAKVGSSTSTSFTDTGLTNGTSYSYQVSAFDTHGNESALSSTVSATPQAPAGAPHIMVILMENHGAGAIIGNSSAPFQNSLTSSYITLTNWTGVDHPSAPNYVALGAAFDNGSTGAGDCSPSIGSSCDYPGNNLGNQMFAADIPTAWFAEDLSGNGCSISNSESGNNDVNHEPWAYLDMWQQTPGACAEAGLTTTSPNDPQVISALDSASPPDFVWVTPNLTDDTHNGTVSQGDTYLKNLVTAVQGTSWYADGGTIVITYDEDEGETNPPGYCTSPVVLPAVGATCIPTFIVSAKDANVGAVSTPGDHYGLVRSLEECYALPLLNNAAAVNASGQATYGDIKSRLC